MPPVRPHQLSPSIETIRLVLCYRNLSQIKGVSHIGLGVTALNIQKVLKAEGIWVEVWPCATEQELGQRLDATQQGARKAGQPPVSHIVISAPWISPAYLQMIAHMHSDVEFAVCSHSNVGFLSADPKAIELLRVGADLQLAVSNFHIAANSARLTAWWQAAYARSMTLLPNLYDTSSVYHQHRQWQPGTPLKIGAFGAVRQLKNLVSAAAAAIEISARLRCDLSLYLSTGRIEGAGTTLSAIREMVTGIASVTLKEAGWHSWPEFRTLVRSMHLLLQPSYSETFNNVTADGIAEGVPSVISDAIDWAPASWKAPVDSVSDIASTGIALLHDPQAAANGLVALQTHNRNGVAAWKNFLLGGA